MSNHPILSSATIKILASALIKILSSASIKILSSASIKILASAFCNSKRIFCSVSGLGPSRSARPGERQRNDNNVVEDVDGLVQREHHFHFGHHCLPLVQ